MTGKYLFRVNSDFAIKTWNASMEKLSNRSAKSIIGQNINKVFPALYNKIKLVFRDGRNRGIQNTSLLDAGFSCRVEINAIKNKNGKVKEVAVALNNIKTEDRPEKKITSSDEKMIEIGKIASSLAHGVRNPLNAIKGAVAYLREKYGHEATLLEFSTIINDEINKLDTFISNFLSAARGGLKIVPADINDVVNRIIVMIRPRARTQNINISHDLSELPILGMDPFQIEQALFNIVNNALEAMPNGGNLDIKTSSAWEKDIDYTVVEITDTGKGIPKKQLNTLGELDRKSENSNRGFGIFLSREIIKSHNGKLLWESIKGKGTTFKVFLPLNS